MLKTLTACVVGILFCFLSYANDYDDAWASIRKKDFKEAKRLLQKATQDKSTALDAYLTLLYLQTYQGNEANIQGLTNEITSSPDKNAYIYSLWFNGAVLGQYGKKKDYQMDLLNKIIADDSYNGSLRSAAHYVKGMHYVFSNDYARAMQEWKLVDALDKWQLTGPFENLSGSGFNTQFGPLSSPDVNAKFKGLNNVEVGWFTPSKTNGEGWYF